MSSPVNPPPDVDQVAAEIIRAMNTRLGEVTLSVQRVILADIPELRGDRTLVELLRDSVEGNVATIFAAIANGIPPDGVTPPTAALEYARRLAQHDVSPNALVRAYRLGQQDLLRQILQEIRSRGISADVALDAFEAVNISASKYIDWISERVVDVYQVERDRWRESRGRILAQRVDDLLADGPQPTADDASAALRYPMARHHLAVVLWLPGDPDRSGELSDMEHFVSAAAVAVGSVERPLFLAQDRVTGWAWIPLYDNAVDGAADALSDYAQRAAGGPSVAIGEPRRGVSGFRRSHQLAQAARSVALVVGRDRSVTLSAEPGVMIAAMLGAGDLSQAGAWVRDVLGDLASPSDGDASLRETVRIFLACGASFKDAAEALHLHSNSVKYRVRRAEERRGRPLEEGRLDVEVALLLCERFPAVVGLPVPSVG